MNKEAEYFESPIHQWFELSYAQYLTIPRSIMEAMPEEWQKRMAKCLQDLDEQIDWRPKSGRYWVKLKNEKGQYVSDPLIQYRHPDIKLIELLKNKAKTKEQIWELCIEEQLRACGNNPDEFQYKVAAFHAMDIYASKPSESENELLHIRDKKHKYFPGNYSNTCAVCGTDFDWADKMCFVCEECCDQKKP